jgi:hypothetical protein
MPYKQILKSGVILARANKLPFKLPRLSDNANSFYYGVYNAKAVLEEDNIVH